MLRLLDVLATIIKYCLWLTLARLASTALGLEFGISRQYLRLLEWLLDRGQAKIERCESEHRLQLATSEELPLNMSNWESQHTDRRPACNLSLPERGQIDRENYDGPLSHDTGIGQINGNVKERKRRLGIRFSRQISGPPSTSSPPPPPPIGSTRDDCAIFGVNKLNARPLIRRRRVSTPDGPPVFLLDDDFDNNQDFDSFHDGHNENNGSNETRRREFHLGDAWRFVARGAAAIIDDEVTKRFTPEQLKGWNLLTRTNAKNYQFMSRSLGLCWLVGLIIRYALLMPLRVMFTGVGFAWLISTMGLIGLMPRNWRAGPYSLSSLMSFRMLSCGITSRLQFHNRQWRARRGDICVANHTSPIDVVLLACDNCYALVGQRHGGLLGILEVALSRATNHVWFDRSESRDRKMVTQKLSEHVARKSNLPVLIFPEGTCINNSAVMRFSKGIFGLDTTVRVCPVALKYDSRFGDPFWCSSKQSYLQYLLMMMSSWAIKCDVWYLPPMERLEDESSAEFANRVKSEIAKQAGLEDLSWDGQLKRTSVKPTWLYQQQEDYVKRLKLE